MERRRFDLTTVFLLAAIAFYGYLEYRLVLYASYVPDEFLHNAWGGDIHSGIPVYAADIPGKTRLSMLLFSLAYKLADQAEDVMLINRNTVFLIVVLSLYVLFLLCRRTFGSPRGALWAVLWTLACSTFSECSFRIRADMIATFFALFGLYQFLALRSVGRVVAAGVCLSLAFCTTQKSVYFIVAFLVSFWVAYRRVSSNALRDFVAFSLAGLAVFVSYIFLLGQAVGYLNVVQVTFADPWLIRTTLGKHFTWSHQYYLQTFFRNIAFYGLSFAGLGYFVRYWRSSTWEQKFLLCFSLIVLAFMMVHREPWPYVFVMVIPLLGCYAGFLSDQILGSLRTSPRILALPVIVLLFMVFVGSIFRHKAHLSVTCLPQLKTIRAAEAILDPKDSYFDGNRMIGTRKSASSLVLQLPVRAPLVTSWETQGRLLLDELRANQCKVIIYNENRLAALPDEFHQFILDHFVLIDQNVFVSGAEITSSPREVNLLWPGSYGLAIHGECKKIQIDGTAAKPMAEILLDAGKHQVGFEGKGSLLLIPLAARRWMEKHAVERRIEPLFPDQYNL